MQLGFSRFDPLITQRNSNWSSAGPAARLQTAVINTIAWAADNVSRIVRVFNEQTPIKMLKIKNIEFFVACRLLGRYITDNVHGQIELPDLAKIIVNTQPFKRLKSLKQVKY